MRGFRLRQLLREFAFLLEKSSAFFADGFKLFLVRRNLGAEFRNRFVLLSDERCALLLGSLHVLGNGLVLLTRHAITLFFQRGDLLRQFLVLIF